LTFKLVLPEARYADAGSQRRFALESAAVDPMIALRSE
jgi:hypothetical protein